MKVWKSIFLLPLLGGPLAPASFSAMEFKEAEITTVKNTVAHDPGTGAAPAKVNEKIGENSKVTTAASSMAELMFADTSITRLGANSLFSFQSKERLIKLEQGSVLVNTPPGNGGATVDCGGVTGAVSGTTFMASRDAAGNVMFLLLEGSGGLKVTINTPSGPVSKEIRPGQAATVGSGTIKAAGGGDDTPGGGTDAKRPDRASAGGEEGDKSPENAPRIQVFDVDVKKIVETAPLIKEFKNELPSMEKIENTIEKQQTAVRDGKMEKLEVEVVAVKEDGDILVGAPKVDPADMKVVNRREVPDAGLDIDTAAGPGEGTRAGAAPPPVRDAPPTFLPPPPSGNLAGLTANEAGGAELPPSKMELVVRPGSVTVSLDRKALRDRVVTLSGFAGLPATVTIPRGADSVTLSLDPALIFPGFSSDATAGLQAFAISAVSGTLSAAASSTSLFPLTTMQAANPARLLPSPPKDPADLLALDAYFFFSDRVAGVSGGPSAFFDPSSLWSLEDFVFGASPAVDLRLGQDFVFHAAGKVTAGLNTDMVTFSATTARPSFVIYGDEISLVRSATWTGLDWVGGVPPTGSINDLVLDRNKPYAFLYNTDPLAGPIGYFDDLGFPYDKSNFPVWNDAGGSLVGATNLRFDPGTVGGSSWILAAGDQGLRVLGLNLDAGGGSAEFQSLGDLEITTAKIANTGSGNGTDPTLRVEAKGTVRVGGASETEQVRFEGGDVDTAAGMAPAPQSLAIIRSDTALELRNLTLRSFDGTRLEKTGLNSGRILLSGSTVRDFKIKELTGLAVNADAKIQMMAVNGNGQLEGEMQVEGSLPVATKLASLVDATITGELGDKAVHANEIDLAARQIQLNNATLTAMNSITARANTLIIQNSFMTVVRSTGMINFYVGEGLVNRVHNTTVANQLNFYGTSGFTIGAGGFTISSSQDILDALSSGKMIETTTPQAGKVNVMKL